MLFYQRSSVCGTTTQTYQGLQHEAGRSPAHAGQQVACWCIKGQERVNGSDMRTRLRRPLNIL